MTPHVKRWLTGIVATPLLFAVIYFGSEIAFFFLVLLLTLGGVAEYNKMVFGGSFFVAKSAGYAACLLLPLAAFTGGTAGMMSVTALLFIASFLLFLGGLKEGSSFDISPLARALFGFLYIPLMMSHLVLLRNSKEGVLWVFLMIVLAFSGDIAAFYAGRTFGKRKLMAHVSAGKTVEGTIGSIAGSIACCVLFKFVLLPDLPVLHAVILGLVGNVIGELGDLCESVLKRGAGVKDSGFLFPGHGGVLDRLDCILFVAPFLFYYRMYIIGLL